MDIKIVSIDMDDTLVEGGMYKFLEGKGIDMSHKEDIEDTLKHWWGQLDGKVTKKELVEYAKGLKIRKDVSRTLKILKDGGYHIILVSGSPVPVVERIFKRLPNDRVEKFYGSELDFSGKEDSLVFKEDVKWVIKEEKKRVAEEFAKSKDLELANVCHIGDGLTDLELLKSCGFGIGVMVNPRESTRDSVEEVVNSAVPGWEEIYNLFNSRRLLEFLREEPGLTNLEVEGKIGIRGHIVGKRINEYREYVKKDREVKEILDFHELMYRGGITLIETIHARPDISYHRIMGKLKGISKARDPYDIDVLFVKIARSIQRFRYTRKYIRAALWFEEYIGERGELPRGVDTKRVHKEARRVRGSIKKS